VGFFFTDGYAYAPDEPALGKLFWPAHLGEGTVGVAVGGAQAAQFVVRVVRPAPSASPSAPAGKTKGTFFTVRQRGRSSLDN